MCTTYEDIHPANYENQPVEKGRQFSRNTQDGHLDFQNKANFSLKEAYLSKNISCKFFDTSWCSFPMTGSMLKTSLLAAVLFANSKPKHLLDACGEYNQNVKCISVDDCKWAEYN